MVTTVSLSGFPSGSGSVFCPAAITCAFCSTVVVIGSGMLATCRVTRTSTWVPGKRKPATPTTSSVRSEIARIPSGIIDGDSVAGAGTGQLAFQNRFSRCQRVEDYATDQCLSVCVCTLKRHGCRPINQVEILSAEHLPCFQVRQG